MQRKGKEKRFVRYAEGAEMYSMSISKFQQLAKDARQSKSACVGKSQYS